MSFAAESEIQADDISQIRHIFESALEISGAERDAFLQRACRDNCELKNLLLRMIATSEETVLFLDEPPTIQVDPADSGARRDTGSRIGPYSIISELGAGGMGSVYLAEHVSGRRVALKFVIDFSPALADRFGHEQEILKHLHHPNIASFLDSGMTPDGLPYLVMEYVEGVSIDRYCEEQALSIPERLRLFRSLCNAVRYLHQNLIVHRDLKPANVLIAEAATVKLVDFGIAKSLQPGEVGSTTAHTARGMMTPDYASPEQVRGATASTLTDVYSLGALLFHILTGRRPFDTPGESLHEKLRRICEDDPVRPSSAVLLGSIAERRTTARKLKGDLDQIVLKAMRKEPGRRYGSVEQFDEDIRRFLEQLPVSAQGDSLSYRAGKWMARHRAGAAAAAVILCIVIAGVVGIWTEATVARQERFRAQRQAEQAQRLGELAEKERRQAEQQRAAAEQNATEARQQRAAAEQRLAALEGLAHRAAERYSGAAAARDAENPLTGATIDLLKTLGNLHKLNPPLAKMLKETKINWNGSRPPADSSWKVPHGWLATEDAQHEYFVGMDRRIVYKGKSSLILQSLAVEPSGRAWVFQSVSARQYRGKRVRLRGYLQSAHVTGSAGMWINIPPNDGGDLGVFRLVSVCGTQLWELHSLVIDVPADADWVRFGVVLGSAGALWADDFEFQTVSTSVPLTAPPAIPVRPSNLNFTERVPNHREEKHDLHTSGK